MHTAELTAVNMNSFAGMAEQLKASVAKEEENKKRAVEQSVTIMQKRRELERLESSYISTFLYKQHKLSSKATCKLN